MPTVLRSVFVAAVAASLFISATAAVADDNPLATLALRPIGPAITSGRISDFAFHPERKYEFYVATASGNLWKTENNGITWQPLMDGEASYSFGVVELDPNDPNVIWVGSGENNAQRSVAYGDGVYRSTDGGKSWSNMGLTESDHISQIWIDPDDSDTVLVAAQGPLWSAGGDRGLYRSTDGGESWEAILAIDEHTGVNEFVVDPGDSNVIVASSHQRRRHVWTLIHGGPGSGIHKTTDGGETWTEITSGLPDVEMGRIGLAAAPSKPNLIYAIIEAADGEGGTFRSTDFGNTWEKRSDYVTNSPQYYNELIVDPHNPERVYAVATITVVSEDGGESFAPLGQQWRHVDDHALWIDPDDTDHLYIGGDGGIYETFDRGKNWRFVDNLSIAQFYRVQPDNAEPFYNVCGGTQDNNSLCGPSRTTAVHGVTNSDWNIILLGDGYEPQIDPEDPNIVYTQYQYGGLARYDKRTQERVFIAPHPGSGENAYNWNWNTPIIISPHDRERIYYASEQLFRSDDRGNTWRAVSGDLTRDVDRNELEVMGRVWSVDSVAKNTATSIYGAAIGLSESTLVEGLIYVGTDDGVMNVTEDGGATWRQTTSFRGVPDMSLIEDVQASMHDVDTVYAVIDNHKRGDYKPYVLKSTNRGRSWSSISGDLPERGSAHTIVEDHVDPDLLFVGTEFGLFFTQDGGGTWHELKTNFPTIAVRDVEIQRRENDLIVGTFGRGVYILDDYSPLRTPLADLTDGDAHAFEPRDSWIYIEGDLWGMQEKAFLGESFFTAPNPPYGAVFTYYLPEDLETRAETRKKAEREQAEAGEDNPYPDWETLRREDREEKPSVVLVIRDGDGQVVARVPGDTSRGLHRTAWDMRLPAPDAVSLEQPTGWIAPWDPRPRGPLATPGEYSMTLMARSDGELRQVAEPVAFVLKSLPQSPETASDPEAVLAFQRKAAELYRAVDGAKALSAEMANRIAHLKAGIAATPAATEAEAEAVRAIEARLADVDVELSGDSTVASRNESVPWPVARRVATVYQWLLDTRSPVPGLYEASYDVAASEFEDVLAALTALESDLAALETRLERMGAPHTPGRIPLWSDRR